MITDSSDPMLPHLYRIRRRQMETHDTFTLELEPTHGSLPFHFAAGQFNMLYLFGVGEVPISMSGSPQEPDRLIHTIRAVGTVTSAISKLREGEMLGVRGPFGTHWPVEQCVGKDVVIVAGGIGLAPLRPAIYQLLAEREKYGQIVLLYGTRTPNDLLFESELHKWRARFDLEVDVTVDRASPQWHGHVGVVTTLIPRASFNAAESVAMICGPEIMMRFTIQALQKRGMTDEQIFITMERNMKCAIGFCGHCQFGPQFICKDGPVFRYDQVQPFFGQWEV